MPITTTPPIPPALLPALEQKLAADLLDAGDAFTFLPRSSPAHLPPSQYTLHTTTALSPDTSVYLIDHHFNFTFATLPNLFKGHPQLLDQLAPSFNCKPAEVPAHIWSFAHALPPPPELDTYSSFYVCDTVGLSLTHSDTPNFAIATLIYNNIPFTVLYPLGEVPADTLVTIDFFPEAQSDLRPFLRARLQPTLDPSTISAPSTISPPPPPPAPPPPPLPPLQLTAPPLTIYCDSTLYLSPSHVTDPRFTLTLSPAAAATADIHYLFDHTKDDGTEHVHRDKLTTLFHFDGLIVSKEHFATTIQKYEATLPPTTPSILPTTYNLANPAELHQYLLATSSGQPFIIKRYRGRQSIDYPITTNPTCALAHVATAPRLACEYLMKIDTWRGRKYDIRFWVVVKSLSPLVVYRYAEFSARVANNEWDTSPESLTTFQTHFTAMGMLGSSEFKDERGTGVRQDPPTSEFIDSWNDTHPDDNFDAVLKNVDASLLTIFEAVTHVYPSLPHPTGQPISPNATWSLEEVNQGPGVCMYGVDVMVMEDLSVKVLEVQWAPDTDLIYGKVDKEFWNETFRTMFLERDEAKTNRYVRCTN